MLQSHPIHRSASVAAILGVALLAAAPVWAQKIGTLGQPTLSCGVATQVSIPIIFTAGATAPGAPAGLTLQWMTEDDFIANGDNWYSSSDERLCKGSFSGNAFGHYYSIGANESTSIQIGDSIFDNPGASSNCASDPLVCGTTYIFRSFAHATRSHQRSPWSDDLVCSTQACDLSTGCTLTQGYWKTHGPVPTGNNSNEWPVTSLSLGTTLYTDLQILAIFNKPAAGNGLIALAHQLIAAELNIANGADDSAVAAAVASAHALIGSLVVPPIGSGSLHPSLTSGLTTTLASYNEGVIGPGHCD